MIPRDLCHLGPDLSSSYGGAGGIGGLVAYCDDDYDASNNPDPDLGPMYPIYDGNGNVVRMCRFAAVSSGGFSGVECRTAAAYEYGPFGEALSVTGEDLGPAGGGGQGQRNPFRFSTKYTDAETGLVYYGYRYYSPSMGRWVNRDPIEEAGGLNTLLAFHNRPIDAVDFLGLHPDTQVYSFSGINNFTSPGVGRDYVGDALIARGVQPSYRWHSKLGFGPNYAGRDRLSKLKWDTATAATLDEEARRESGRLDWFKEGALCPTCWYDLGTGRGHRRWDEKSKNQIHVIMIAPKTIKKPSGGACCDVSVDVFWSPYDLVPNGTITRGNSRGFWQSFGIVHVVDTLYNTLAFDDMRSGLFPNHELSAFINPTYYLMRQRSLTRPWTSDYDSPLDLMKFLRYAMNSTETDYVWVCHSQGCNMAMYALARACSKPKKK